MQAVVSHHSLRVKCKASSAKSSFEQDDGMGSLSRFCHFALQSGVSNLDDRRVMLFATFTDVPSHLVTKQARVVARSTGRAWSKQDAFA